MLQQGIFHFGANIFSFLVFLFFVFEIILTLITREPNGKKNAIESADSTFNFSVWSKTEKACKYFMVYFTICRPRLSTMTHILAALQIQFVHELSIFTDDQMCRFLQDYNKTFERFFYEKRSSRFQFFYSSFRGQSAIYTKGALEAFDLFTNRKDEEPVFGNPRLQNKESYKVVRYVNYFSLLSSPPPLLIQPLLCRRFFPFLTCMSRSMSQVKRG